MPNGGNITHEPLFLSAIGRGARPGTLSAAHALEYRRDAGSRCRRQTARHFLRWRKILAPKVFAKAHIAEWGGSVEWFDTEFGADNVYAWTKEQAGEPSHEMLNDWMRRNELSLTTAAEALGLSRRMVSYYRTAQKAIPKTVWLACLGCDSLRQQAA